MSDSSPPVPPAPPPSGGAAAVEPDEFVLRGLFFALGAVLVGSVLAVVLWEYGYIASITSFIIAFGGVFLYVKGAGAGPRKGAIPLVILIVLGVVVSFFAIVATDLWRAFPQVVKPGVESRYTFITDNLVNGGLLKDYLTHMVMFFVFALLGGFGALRRLMRR